ncbi:MAG: MotA/TolQ/ExbB proton channel family protein [candidate division KSB1 bacterium]|nr:MotA/TolQ/ExbB proton channel family protein [candidate division KSB1 bacterium]MDZ7273062.1 MotA/TolQ/ExbB proton channel family protein [candidate division KSB1 bacterium]MDZ7285165.1 MotA/TolQ/ExbB proton channel family protein [candidate division KSB1 bacterium]MDZ7298197.1 MotA/TolQ/ExbB proton channel family protein [candidate division KSB1 bacterium]MDZ7306871.1 MotA/TolQ/ExbB proton channel family protein [candidate division KSB1 bacterium]
MDSFIESFRWEADGALYMYAILVVGAFAVAIAIERAYFLMVKANINANKFMSEIRKLVRAGEYKKALALCDAAPEKALAQVVGASLRRVAEQEVTDFRSIQNSVDESTLEVIPRLNQRTGFLAMLANVATLLGLMGTIWGLILAFKAVSSAGIDAAEKARMLAAGISAAMNTTLLGLAVAIPSVLAYTFLFNKTARIIDEIDEHTVKLINLLTGNK